MTNDEIIQYYDYLMKLAISKCNCQVDAEDLVGETILAAFDCLYKGEMIKHPKTWLTHTLCYKYNDYLRKKYHSPIIICLDENHEILEEEETDYFALEDAAKVRKELNHLAHMTREIMIRFYYGNQSVSDIAKDLCIPEGTIKRRLSIGRNQMKKGLETMEIRENDLPRQLYLSFGGIEGLKQEPISLVQEDLIAQNLLILAYNLPVTISELSKAIGIPSAYIEPIIQKLINGELMAQTKNGKIYSDFIITTSQDALKYFKPQLEFAHKHFNSVWKILQKLSNQIYELPSIQHMGMEEKTKLERYAFLKTLQDFQHYGTGKIKAPIFPKRKDGGRWLAQALAIDAGYNSKEYQNAQEYAIHGGHRITEATEIGRMKRICFYEFDTTLWDCPHRYGRLSDLYFKHIIPLLWYIYDNISLETSNIPNEFISYIPMLEKFGILGHIQNKLLVKIPVMAKYAYQELCCIIQNAIEEIKSTIGDEYTAFITSMKTPIPKHLTSVPELYRYDSATRYFVMAIIKEAYNKGLHLKNVDYCCPPVVLVYEEK